MRTTMAALAVAMLTTPALAADYRYPATDNPALVVSLPADWSQKEANADHATLAPADNQATIMLKVGQIPLALDAAAALLMQNIGATTPKKEGPADISGYKGFSYTAVFKPPGDMGDMHLRLVIVQIAPGQIALVNVLTTHDATPAAAAAAAAILKSARLTLK